MTIDWKEYREIPPKLVGLDKDAATALLQSKQFMFGIAREDGVEHILPAILQIVLNVRDGKVVGTSLDGNDYGDWT